MKNFNVKKKVQLLPEYISAHKIFVKGDLKDGTIQDPNSNLQSKETPACHKKVRKNNRYSCPVCKIDLLSMDLRNKHIKFHIQKLSEMCSLCGKYFANSVEYFNHSYYHIILKRQMKRQLCRFSNLKLSRVIPKREILKCDKCLQRYVDIDRYTDHISQCQSYRCKACLALFDETHLLNKHIVENTIQHSYQCDTCAKEFYLKCHLLKCSINEKMAYKHFPISNLEYHICHNKAEKTDRSVNKLGLKDTSLRLSMKNSRTCCIQEKKLVPAVAEKENSGTSFPTHKTKEYNCKICSTTFLTKNSLDNHVCHTQEKESVHPLNESEKKQSSETSFQCNICLRYFPLQRSLLCHLVRTHGDKQFSCRLCSRIFLTKNRLNSHSCSIQENKLNFCKNQSGSIGERETIFKCKFCSTNGCNHFCRKPLRYPMVLSDKIHHGRNKINKNVQKLANKSVSTESTKILTCEICFKDFQLKRTLDCHMRMHKIELKCKNCSKTFLTKNSYENHLCCQKNETKILVNKSVITKNKNLFRCELCSESFPLKRNLYCHKRKHIQLKCKTCFRIFSTVYNNKNHVCYNQ